MAIKVKDLRELLSQFPGEMTVIGRGDDEFTYDYLDVEIVSIVDAFPEKHGYSAPRFVIDRSQKDKDKIKKFVYIGPYFAGIYNGT